MKEHITEYEIWKRKREMTWNYRIFKKEGETAWDDDEYAIHEVFYDEDGHIYGYSERTISPFGTTVEELQGDLENMLLSIQKPVLTEEGLFPKQLDLFEDLN